MKKYKFNGNVNTVICKGAVLGGNFSAPESARIDGTIEGDVTIKGFLILGDNSVVNGNVKAEAAMIGGVVNGNVDAPGKVQLTAKAKVIGDITTESLVVDENAVFQGKCDMNKAEAAEEVTEEVKETEKTEEKTEEAKAEETKAEEKAEETK